MVKVLGWVTDRWQTELEPTLKTAVVGQEQALRALWEQELAWWKEKRHLQGDSLRNPITQVRYLISQLPLTDENSWLNSRTGKREHIGLRVFNLAEGEWVAMNDRSRATTQERLNQQQLISDPEGIVHRAFGLLLSDDWAELVVGIALATGRRLAEILKTGKFSVKEPYSVWFEGQVKGRTRITGRYELPTLVRAYLVVEAAEKLRRLVDCREVELLQVSQKYGKAVNDAVERVYADKISARADRDRITAHTLRNLYGAIAVLWFCPDPVSDVNFKAYIQGHRAILDPDVPEGTSQEEIEEVKLDYASHANYSDYQLADAEGKYDGRRGIKLGLPGVTVLDYFAAEVAKSQKPVQPAEAKAKRGRQKKTKSENQTGYSNMKPSVETKAWADDERLRLSVALRREVKEDEFIRRLLVAYTADGTPEREAQHKALSLDDLDLDASVRELFQKALAFSGTSDLLTFLLAVGEREARQIVSTAAKHDTALYARMTSSKLATMKVQAATAERIRRGVYAIMQWNEQHAGEPLQQWYLTTLAIQNLVGGRKETIKEYQDAIADEIEEHHRRLGIQPNYNRKPVSIGKMITVPEEAGAYPWGKPPAAQEAEVSG